MTTYFLIVFFNAIKNADWGGGDLEIIIDYFLLIRNSTIFQLDY